MFIKTTVPIQNLMSTIVGVWYWVFNGFVLFIYFFSSLHSADLTHLHTNESSEHIIEYTTRMKERCVLKDLLSWEENKNNLIFLKSVYVCKSNVFYSGYQDRVAFFIQVVNNIFLMGFFIYLFDFFYELLMVANKLKV